MRLRAWCVALILCAVATGCATFKNTPEQEYVYAMARPCEGNGVQITWVSSDGKQWRGHWTGGAYTWPEFQACLADQYKARPYQEWLKSRP